MNNEVDKHSLSNVIFMCGPAGAGKSTYAMVFKDAMMTILSYDEESFKRGLIAHPLPEETAREIKTCLDRRLISLLEQHKDVVLDYSFWSREMRNEYILLLEGYNIKPLIYYIKTPKEVVMQRLRNRRGSHQNDIILSEQIASFYYDNFQPPTADEGEIIVVEDESYNV